MCGNEGYQIFVRRTWTWSTSGGVFATVNSKTILDFEPSFLARQRTKAVFQGAAPYPGVLIQACAFFPCSLVFALFLVLLGFSTDGLVFRHLLWKLGARLTAWCCSVISGTSLFPFYSQGYYSNA